MDARGSERSERGLAGVGVGPEARPKMDVPSGAFLAQAR
jgi:hypothetical protein